MAAWITQPIGLAATAVVSLVVVLALWAGLGGPDAPAVDAVAGDAPRVPTEDIADRDPHTAVLYYVAEDGLSLIEVEQELAEEPDRLSRARAVVERQLEAAPPPLVSPIPDGTQLRAVYIVPGNDVFVDLSGDVAAAHPGGSLNELFTVYAIVNAVTTNMPDIAGVQLLVDGHEVDTLAGHVDLRRPLERNMKWVSQPEDANE